MELEELSLASLLATRRRGGSSTGGTGGSGTEGLKVSPPGAVSHKAALASCAERYGALASRSGEFAPGAAGVIAAVAAADISRLLGAAAARPASAGGSSAQGGGDGLGTSGPGLGEWASSIR